MACSGAGGGINRGDGTTFTVRSSIVAGNSGYDCAGGISDGGRNLESSDSCGFAFQNAVLELSDGLADQGGETYTLPMNGGSPAVDAGGACTGADQRDVARPQGEACDSGAVEIEPGVSISSGPTGPTNRSAVAFGFTSPDAPGFECRLDAGAPGTYSPCASPQGFSGLADGEYRFLVRAVDANFQPVGAAVRSFARAAAVRGGPCRARNGARPGPEP